MKHYFGATADGRLYWTFVIAGGYDNTTCDLESDDPQCPHALHLLSVHNKNMKANEVLDHIVVFNCPCPPGNDAVCNCPSNKRLEAYSNGGTLTDKPACVLLIDGVDVAGESLITRAPNAMFTAQLVADPLDIEDGETASIYSHEMLEAGSAVMTFTNGATNTVTLRAPAQGVKGYLSIGGNMVCPHRLYVKGFSPVPS